ncbi:MAG TPA: DNA-binding protein [Longimicrobiales bacterium]|nr:DNA-binding protein [Longimicrobiales bacterium]
MASKGTFLLRTDPAVLDALRAWANDEFRSVNGQIEFVLRRALADAGRLKGKGDDAKKKTTKKKP